MKNHDWPLGTVDRFVLRQLERKAHPGSSRRSLYTAQETVFRSHGLPPTPEEIQHFVNDDSPDAYQRLIDRLLESPRFGERWARHWMDLVRYSESHAAKATPTSPRPGVTATT